MTSRYAFAFAVLLGSASFAHAQDGSSCGNAISIVGQTTYTADTTTATNWMTVFGPLVSPSNDIAYTFSVSQGGNVNAFITPTVANYAFALYLIPSCSDLGTQVAPIGATATIGNPISLAASGVTGGNTYYLAVTGTAAGGSGANGTLTFDVSGTPVTLQSFTIE